MVAGNRIALSAHMTPMTAVAEHPTTADLRTHYVYRLYDAVDRLLYVGMTNDPGQRLRDHKRTKPWWGEVYRHEIEETATRADAFFVEAAAILKEKPAYNLDIPSLERYDVLKSRSTLTDPMTSEDRIAALEHQLREARRDNYRLAAEDRDLEKLRAEKVRLEAENKELREAAAAAAESHTQNQQALLDVVDSWRSIADGRAAELEAKEQVRVFVVEGPRVAPAVAAPAAAAEPAPKRSLLARLLG